MALPLGLALVGALLLALPQGLREPGLMGLWRTCLLALLLVVGGGLFWNAWLDWTDWAFDHWGT